MNKENEKFIEWAMNYIDDDVALLDLKTQVLASLSQFLDLRKDQIAEILKKKLIRGGLEHDITAFDLSNLDKEIQDEHIDLFGWELVGLYLNRG